MPHPVHTHSEYPTMTSITARKQGQYGMRSGGMGDQEGTRMKVILRTIAGIGIYFGGMVPAVLLSEIWRHGTASGPTAYMTGAFVGVVICAIFK